MTNKYQFPLIETDTSLSINTFKSHPKITEFIKTNTIDYRLYNEEDIIHKLSHQHLYTKFWIIETDQLPTKGIPIKDLKKYPTSILISNFIDRFNFPV